MNSFIPDVFNDPDDYDRDKSSNHSNFDLLDDDVMGREEKNENYNNQPLNMREQSNEAYYKYGVPKINQSASDKQMSEEGYYDEPQYMGANYGGAYQMNYNPDPREMGIKQEAQENYRVPAPEAPKMEKIEPNYPKQEYLPAEENNSGELEVIMQKNLLHLYKFVAKYNGGLT